MDRKYNPNVIDSAFARVKAMPRQATLEKVQRDNKQKTAFITTYDPRLPNMGSLIQTHYKTLTLDPNMKEVFKDGMVVGYKRHRNIKEFLFRAKLYDPGLYNGRPQRCAAKGWRRCSTCTTCKHSENRNRFTCKATGETFKIQQNITCKEEKVLYIIECKVTHLQYVGKSIQSLMNRGRQHIQAVESLTRTKDNKLYRHFSSPGHSHADMIIYAIEKIHEIHGDEFVLAVRE